MKNEITDKTFCVVTNYGHKIFLTKKEFDVIFINYDDLDSIKLVGRAIIAKKYITLIGKSSEIEEEDREKKGEWKCAYGHWHKRGEQCGHAEQSRYNIKK